MVAKAVISIPLSLPGHSAGVLSCKSQHMDQLVRLNFFLKHTQAERVHGSQPIGVNNDLFDFAVVFSQGVYEFQGGRSVKITHQPEMKALIVTMVENPKI